MCKCCVKSVGAEGAMYSHTVHIVIHRSANMFIFVHNGICRCSSGIYCALASTTRARRAAQTTFSGGPLSYSPLSYSPLSKPLQRQASKELCKVGWDHYIQTSPTGSVCCGEDSVSPQAGQHHPTGQSRRRARQASQRCERQVGVSASLHAVGASLP